MKNKIWEGKNGETVECEIITDRHKLMPGDIIEYKSGGSGGGAHIEMFAGYDENGKALRYSTGSTRDIQTEGPTTTENYCISGDWVAYRLPEIKGNINKDKVNL